MNIAYWTKTLRALKIVIWCIVILHGAVPGPEQNACSWQIQDIWELERMSLLQNIIDVTHNVTVFLFFLSIYPDPNTKESFFNESINEYIRKYSNKQFWKCV